MGRFGAGSCTMREQQAQLSFGRTVRITLKRAGTYSSTSETSSPSGRSVPPQSGQASCFGAMVSISRGSSAGKRTARGFLRAFSIDGDGRQLRGKRLGRGLVRFEIFEPQFQLLDVGVQLLRPLAEVHALELEDEQIQVLDLGLFGEHERFERLDVERVEIGQWFLRFASLLTASIPQLCHAQHDNDVKIRKHFQRRNVLYRHGRRSRSDRPSPVDAFQQHRELRAAQRHHAFVRLRPDEAAAFETLGEQTQAVAIPPEHFDQIAAPAAEDEHVTRVRILFEHGLRDGAQAGEAAAHIGDAGGDPDVRARGQRDHRPSCSRIMRRFSGSTSPSTRMRARPSSMWIVPEAERATACCSTAAIFTQWLL